MAGAQCAACTAGPDITSLDVALRRLVSASVGSPFGSRILVSLANGWGQQRIPLPAEKLKSSGHD